VNFILTWAFRVDYFAAFDVFVAHYAFVAYRPASHFNFFIITLFSSGNPMLLIRRGSATRAGRGKRKPIAATRIHIRIWKGAHSLLARRLRCSSVCDRLKTLHASPERATSSVTQASALGSADSTAPRHPNLHHRRTQNRQVLNVRRPVQLVFIQGFVDLAREPG